eukprot:6185427-Pleurochrysis_carterae.AAC.1
MAVVAFVATAEEAPHVDAENMLDAASARVNKAAVVAAAARAGAAADQVEAAAELRDHRAAAAEVGAGLEHPDC